MVNGAGGDSWAVGKGAGSDGGVGEVKDGCCDAPAGTGAEINSR